MADKNTSNILSLIGPGTLIEGKITTEGSVRIDGRLVGDLISKSNVTIGGTGSVEGNVTGSSISLAGKINGTVLASDKLTLEAKSFLRGDIRAQKLVVDEGAVFNGNCSMTPESSVLKTPPVKQ
jgi:cytoskeletal protein CcmA (bactofilin family)